MKRKLKTWNIWKMVPFWNEEGTVLVTLLAVEGHFWSSCMGHYCPFSSLSSSTVNSTKTSYKINMIIEGGHNAFSNFKYPNFIFGILLTFLG